MPLLCLISIIIHKTNSAYKNIHFMESCSSSGQTEQPSILIHPHQGTEQKFSAPSTVSSHITMPPLLFLLLPSSFLVPARAKGLQPSIISFQAASLAPYCHHSLMTAAVKSLPLWTPTINNHHLAELQLLAPYQALPTTKHKDQK